MYLKEKAVKLLKLKNTILTIVVMLIFLIAGFYIVSEFVYYRNDLNTALHAKSMTSSIVMVIISAALLAAVIVSRNRIKDAAFYSSYFEGDLDGYIKYTELAGVTGKSPKKIQKKLHSFRKYYMKGYELKKIDGEETVELYSKKVLCECRSCGANIEKRVFFTNKCPYCESSDLYAKVLADNRFYSISNDFKSGMKNPEYYQAGFLNVRRILYAVLFVLSAMIACIGLMMALTETPKYFDQAYQQEILLSPDNHLYSYELIRADILDSVIFAIALFVIFTPVAVVYFRKVMSIGIATACADSFATQKKPFVKAKSLPDLGLASDENKKLKKVRDVIRRRYLLHCTIEMHDDALMIALAKKIVKDRCSSCGAPIVDAVDENYVCKYCGRKIMGVIEKK